MSANLHDLRKQRIAGILWLVIGLVVLGLSQSIRKPGFASNQDPGPRFFPMMLAGWMVLGGVVHLVRSWIPSASQASKSVDPSVVPQTRAFLLFVVALICFVVLIPWLGFTAATWLFAFGMIWYQGSAWYQALCVSTLLVLGIRLLFGMLFHVQLPAGVLGLP